MSWIAESTFAAIDAGVPRYAEALARACATTPPPFGEAWYGRRYRKLATDPQWVAHSLVMNADIEGDGARKLWAIAAHAPEAAMARQIKRHALDESRHARLYATLLRLVFDTEPSPALEAALRRMSPGYSVRDMLPMGPAVDIEEILDELIQMNLGEIRTRVHQLLALPVLVAHARGRDGHRVDAIMGSLLADETQHVRYTAELIDAACEVGHGAFVRDTMCARLVEFNDITLAEAGGDRFAGE